MNILKRIKEYRYNRECKNNQKIFNSGHDARMKGDERNKNPHVKGSEKYMCWDLGWRVANNIFKDEDTTSQI